MSLWAKVRGTVETIFQIGIGGPQVKANAAAVEMRNAADGAFAIARGADPVGADDLVTKRTTTLVTGQIFNGAATAFPTGTAAALAFTSPSAASTIVVTGDGVKVWTLSYRVTCSVTGVAAGTTGNVQIFDNGVAVGGTLSSVGFTTTAVSATGLSVPGELDVVLSAGSHTLDLRVIRTTAGGVITALLDQRTFRVQQKL